MAANINVCFSAGSGILTEADGSVYEGGFHKSMRHGEGMQMYRYTVDIQYMQTVQVSRFRRDSST